MLATLSLSLLLLLMPAHTTSVVVLTLPRNSVTVSLPPSGKADLKRDATVSRISIEIKNLPPPSTFGAAMNSFVVWAVSPEGDLENVGELAIDKNKGRLQTTTKFDQVGLLVTAEPYYMVDRPSAAVAFRSGNPQDDGIRRQLVPVQVGAYNYSGLVPQKPGAGVPAIVAEARAALQIAKDAGAARWDEAEFLAARAALETSEKLLSRENPPDIVAEYANEAIRLSEDVIKAALKKQVAAGSGS
jgi:hypothetical protein